MDEDHLDGQELQDTWVWNGDNEKRDVGGEKDCICTTLAGRSCYELKSQSVAIIFGSLQHTEHQPALWQEPKREIARIR